MRAVRACSKSPELPTMQHSEENWTQNGAVVPDSWHLLCEVRRDYNARCFPHADLHNPGVLRADVLKVFIWSARVTLRHSMPQQTFPRGLASISVHEMTGDERVIYTGIGTMRWSTATILKFDRFCNPP